jgi:hypothetical protein
MKKIIITILCIICIILGYVYMRSKTVSTTTKIHYHAGFMVYLDGKLQDFSKDIYMNKEFCSLPHKIETPEEIQIAKAHLHDNIGDIVHVHSPGAVWGDLFANIHYSFPDGKQIIGYINGQTVPDILHYPIKPYDSIVIVIGDTSSVDRTKMVSKNHIVEVEKQSEGCSL